MLKVLQAIGYELLPVHPAYAMTQMRGFVANLAVLVAAIGGAGVKLAALLGAAAARTSWRTWACVVLWLALLVASLAVELHQFFLVATGFFLIFTNMGNTRGEGDMSAWSVFNKGFATMPGTTTGAMLDDAIRHRDRDWGNNDDD